MKFQGSTVLCPECGSKNVKKDGNFTDAGGVIVQRMRCTDKGCQRHFNERTADFDLVESNVRLEKKNQRLNDINRVERKSFREHARVENSIAEYTENLIQVFSRYEPSIHKHGSEAIERIPSALIVHLSDLHFNEQVDLPHNQYNFEIASKRLYLLARRVKELISLYHIKRLLIAVTGDLMNSNRRLDELLLNATNRAKATFISFEILKQFLEDISELADIDLASVTGNESRVNDEHGFGDILASDNYDFTITQLLRLHFKDKIRFHSGDMKEIVVTVAGQNILLMHGESMPNTSGNQKAIQQVVGRYARRGIIVDYVLFGHYHSAYVSDLFARSSSLVGSNDYNEKALNLVSKASQNCFRVFNNGNIDKFIFDLQDVEGSAGYTIRRSLEAYNVKSAERVNTKTKILEIVI